jgi:hypothetical protein
MRIFEVLNSPVPYSWHRLPRPGGDEAKFAVDHIGYQMDFMHGYWGAESQPVTTLQYSIDRQAMQQLGRTNMTAPTGLGVPIPVLSTIMAAIHEWFGRNHPERVFFYDGDRKRSRGLFYARIATMLINRYGYELDPDTERVRRTNGNSSVWLLRRAQPATA